MCGMLNLTVFYHAADTSEWAEHFGAFGDTLNSVLALIFIILVGIFPPWVYHKIRKHFKELDRQEVKDEIGLLYEDVDYGKNYHCA